MGNDDIYKFSITGSQLNKKIAIDCTDFVKRDVFLFCCSYFSKMKYWETSSQRNFKNITSITLDFEHNEESFADIQVGLFIQFLFIT